MSSLKEQLKKALQTNQKYKHLRTNQKRHRNVAEIVKKVRNQQHGPQGPKGDTPSVTELRAIIKPLLPTAVEPSDERLKSLIKPLIPNPLPGPRGPMGNPGIQGEMGPMGPIPKHEWKGTKLRFEKPNGKWGAFVDLQGPAGNDGKEGATRDGRLIKGGGASHFHLLMDTPQRVSLEKPYDGYEDYYVKINSTGTGFEYKDVQAEVDNKIEGVNTSKLTLSSTEPVDPEEGDLWVVIA